MSTTFADYKTYAGIFGERDRGNLLSFKTGTTSATLLARQDPGARRALLRPGRYEVYEDQIIGINAKSGSRVTRAEDAVEDFTSRPASSSR